jgi:hypothetical protein
MPLIFKGQLDHQRFRTWGAVAGAAIGVVGSAMSDGGGSKNGGAGTQTQSKEPWLAAQPWIMNNMQQGQALQQQYQNQPFNAQQQQAYANQYAQSDYMRNLVPSLLGQMQKQPIGYDPANPNARPTAWNWDALLGQGGGGAAGSMTAAQAAQDAADAANRNRKPPEKEAPQFTQQGMGYSPLQQQLATSGRSPWLLGQLQTDNHPASTGSFGAYKYGDEPKPGTQAYRDMMEFFLMGGNDPWGISALGGKKPGARADLMGNSGNSVGGSPAADGSGGGTPGPW